MRTCTKGTRAQVVGSRVANRAGARSALRVTIDDSKAETASVLVLVRFAGDPLTNTLLVIRERSFLVDVGVGSRLINGGSVVATRVRQRSDDQ